MEILIISFLKVEIEPTTCLINNRTLVPLYHDWPHHIASIKICNHIHINFYTHIYIYTCNLSEHVNKLNPNTYITLDTEYAASLRRGVGSSMANERASRNSAWKASAAPAHDSAAETS